jgi:undecaprenyl diphosphate synthase
MVQTRLSSNSPVPAEGPRHIAIIMDGNGRWAEARRLPRFAGHAKGVDAVRATVNACLANGVEYLTLFAFSSENWRRPAEEVSVLMRLFIAVLEREIAQMAQHGIRLRVVGDTQVFEPRLRALIEQGQARAVEDVRLNLTICANYGGRWDIIQATRAMLRERPHLAADPAQITETDLAPYLAMAFAPEPDLFIRTGGEQRISNFLLWQLAYSELYFTDAFWPDFGRDALDRALESFRSRERRFGQTSAQVAQRLAARGAPDT